MRLVQHTSFGAETPSRQSRKNEWCWSPYTMIIDDVPEYEAMVYEVRKLLSGEHSEIPITIGWSKVHPNDDFCRKTGLEIAQKRLKSAVAVLSDAWVEKGQMRVELRTDYGKVWLLYYQGKRPVIDVNTIISGNY